LYTCSFYNAIQPVPMLPSSPFDDVGVMAHSKTDEAWLKKLDEYIRLNIKDPNIDIDALAENMFKGRTIVRKICSTAIFRSIFKMSPGEYLQSLLRK